MRPPHFRQRVMSMAKTRAARGATRLVGGRSARKAQRRVPRIFRPPGRLAQMQLAVALTPIVWLVILLTIALGGVAVKCAGARGWWVVAGIAGLLVVTNPSADDHDDALDRKSVV